MKENNCGTSPLSITALQFNRKFYTLFRVGLSAESPSCYIFPMIANFCGRAVSVSRREKNCIEHNPKEKGACHKILKNQQTDISNGAECSLEEHFSERTISQVKVISDGAKGKRSPDVRS